MKIDPDIQALEIEGSKKIAMQIERNEKLWEYFVEEAKFIVKEETKFFDVIMDAGAAAKIQGVKFPYRKYIKEDQMERFNERLLFRILLLKKQNEISKAEHDTKEQNER